MNRAGLPVEDVLISIRRLVSEDEQARVAPPPEPFELTAAMRVTASASDPAMAALVREAVAAELHAALSEDGPSALRALVRREIGRMMGSRSVD